MAAHTRILCDRCGRAVPREAHYRVRIEVAADPSPPTITGEDLAETDFEWTLSQLLEEMRDATAQELEDAVARSFEFRLCRACQLRFTRDPLGRSAGPSGGSN